MKIIEEISFKDYYNSLESKEKSNLRDAVVPTYISYSSFYDKLRDDKFTLLELEKFEQITGKTFVK